MSGHSKWAQIKRQKGANDQKRGLQFTKLSNAITIAVRQGGGIGDPDQNFRLRLAIDAARASNMPKENIQRAIERASGIQAEDMEEVVYEGFGPQGVLIMVEATTDNKNRTTGEVQNAFSKNGGTMGQPGSVSYQFEQKGRIIIAKNGKTLDEIFLTSADSGADDVEEAGDEVFIYTKPNLLADVSEKIKKAGYQISEATLIRKPLTVVTFANEEEAQKIMQFMEHLEELDDVQKVYANIEIA